LNDVEEALNAALLNAADADGNTTFVDMYPASLGHDACAAGAAWIQGKDTNLFAAIAYHPFKSGMVGMANQVSKALGAKTGSGRLAVPRSVDKSVVGDVSTVIRLAQAGHGR
jgi:hypothetical protein